MEKENRDFLITKKIYTSRSGFYCIYRGRANGKEYKLWCIRDFGEIRTGAFASESLFSKVEEVRA